MLYSRDVAENHARLFIDGKSGDQHREAKSKVCNGLRGDTVVAAQQAGLDNLCEIVDGGPTWYRSADQSHARNGFSFDWIRVQKIILPALSFRRTLIWQNGESMEQYVWQRLWTPSRRITSQAGTRFKSGVYCGMPNGVVLRDYPKKVEQPIEVKSVSRKMRELRLWTQEHHRTDATTSILLRKTGTLTFVVLRLSECKELSRKGSKECSVKTMLKIRGSIRKMRHTSRLDSTTGSKMRADPRGNSLCT